MSIGLIIYLVRPLAESLYIFYIMTTVVEVGTVHYTHAVAVIIAAAPKFLEYIDFVMGMHKQGHWGSVGEVDYSASDRGLIAGTSVTSEYELVEQFECFSGSLIITTDLQLAMTLVSMSEGH